MAGVVLLLGAHIENDIGFLRAHLLELIDVEVLEIRGKGAGRDNGKKQNQG